MLAFRSLQTRTVCLCTLFQYMLRCILQRVSPTMGINPLFPYTIDSLGLAGMILDVAHPEIIPGP